MTEIKSFKRIEFEGAGTLEGLLKLVGQIPAEVPLTAEIVSTYNYENLSLGDDDEGEALDGAPDRDPRIGVVFEWSDGS